MFLLIAVNTRRATNSFITEGCHRFISYLCIFFMYVMLFVTLTRPSNCSLSFDYQLCKLIDLIQVMHKVIILLLILIPRHKEQMINAIGPHHCELAILRNGTTINKCRGTPSIVSPDGAPNATGGASATVVKKDFAIVKCDGYWSVALHVSS